MTEGTGSRSVVVTGASRGIGRATTLALIREHDCKVLAIARDAEALASLQEEAGEQSGLEVLALDLSETGSLDRISQAVAGWRVHGLVNNAGLLIKRPFGAWKPEDLQQLFAINVVAAVQLTQALAPNMGGDPKGHVVNIGSMGGFQGSAKFPGLLGYSASKAALANATECIAEEMKDAGICCNCLCIGAVDTAMLREAFPGYGAPVDDQQMGKFIARFVLEAHNLFNGKVLPVALSTP